MKKMKLLRAYGNYRTGQVVDVPGGLAAEWLARRIAVEETQGHLLETAALEQPAERADATPKRRRRQ